MAGLGRRSHYRKHLTDAVLHDLPEPDDRVGRRVARVVGTRGGNMFDVVVAPPSSSCATVEGEGAGGESPSAANDAGRSGEGDETTCERLENDGGDGRPPRGSASAGASRSPPTRVAWRAPQLAFLPTKFRKLVWIKRNDYVIVECGDEEGAESDGGRGRGRGQDGDSSSSGGGGFRYVIVHILYKDQVRHIKSRGLWPPDPFFADEENPSGTGDSAITRSNKDVKTENGDARTDQAEGKGDVPKYGECAYEENGIVFDDPLGDDFAVNTNRLAALCVEDSSSEEESDDN